MTPNDLFQAALQLQGTGWRMLKSEFTGTPPQLELHLEHERGAQVLCPECGQACPGYDTVEKRWRHLNFFQYRCELVARVPRAHCAEHGGRLLGLLGSVNIV